MRFAQYSSNICVKSTMSASNMSILYFFLCCLRCKFDLDTTLILYSILFVVDLVAEASNIRRSNVRESKKMLL